MKFNNIEKGIALLWICLNIILISIGNWGFHPARTRLLWPFESKNFNTFYDLSEFLVYSLAPLLLYISIRYIIKGISDLIKNR